MGHLEHSCPEPGERMSDVLRVGCSGSESKGKGRSQKPLNRQISKPNLREVLPGLSAHVLPTEKHEVGVVRGVWRALLAGGKARCSPMPVVPHKGSEGSQLLL